MLGAVIMFTDYCSAPLTNGSGHANRGGGCSAQHDFLKLTVHSIFIMIKEILVKDETEKIIMTV
jgi:hypothetical protein